MVIYYGGGGVSGVIFPGALLPGRFSSRGDFLRDDFLRGDFPPVAIFSGAIFLRGDFSIGAIFPGGDFSRVDFPRLVIIGVRLVDNLAYSISNRYTFDLVGIMRRGSIATPTQNKIPLSWYFHH